MIIRREPGDALSGTLIFDENEYSFRFEPDTPELRDRVGDKGVTSLGIGTLQLEIAVGSGQALYAWGLYPRTQWSIEPLGDPASESGRLFIQPDEEFEEGVSVRIAPVGAWETSFDPDSGWIRISPSPENSDIKTKIADGVIIGTMNGDLHSIWLHPVMRK